MSRRLKVLIADDEATARKRLARLLAAIPWVEHIGSCTTGTEVLRTLSELGPDGAPDVLLLDINMPGLSGLEASGLLPEPRPYVVFATAHPEHALEAFDLGAVDYVLKPIAAGRLATALERARDRSAAPAASSRGRVAPTEGGERLGAADRLPVPTAGGVRMVVPSDITHAEFDGALVTLWCSGEPIRTDLTLSELEQRLSSARFVRVHRRALLNLRRVARFEPLDTGGYIAHTDTGHSVAVSRRSARELRELLGI